MAALVVNFSFVLDPFWPKDNEWNAPAAFAIRMQLPELDRSVCGLQTLLPRRLPLHSPSHDP
jgi:hypothetical protein